MLTLKVNVFKFFNKSKKMNVSLVLLCPTFPYKGKLRRSNCFGTFVEIRQAHNEGGI